MRILAIETSGRDGSLAALETEDVDAATSRPVRLLRETLITGPERTAQMLAPRLGELLAAMGWEAKSIQLVCVAVGPGSFTGLRIGVTTAKTLAYAVGAEVIGVNTLEVIASQAPQSDSPLWVVMDAQRQELFAAKFADGRMVVETTVLTRSDWMKQFQANDRVSGPGLKRVGEGLPDRFGVVDEAKWQPMASSVGVLGWREYVAGRRSDVWTLTPNYFRLSAAEENHAK